MVSKSTAQVHSPHLKFPALIILLHLTTFFILKHVLFLTSVSQTLLVLFHSLLTYFQSLSLNVDISPGENFQFDTIYMIMIPPNSILNPGVSGASDSYTLFLTWHFLLTCLIGISNLICAKEIFFKFLYFKIKYKTYRKAFLFFFCGHFQTYRKTIGNIY